MAERRIRQSQLSKFRRCRRSWEMEYVRGLEIDRPADSTNGARDLGTTVHAFVERYYNNEDWRPLHAELCATYSTSPEWQESLEMAGIMMEGYVQWVAETAADANEKVLLVEPQLEVEFGTYHGDTVILTGKPDAVKQDELTGLIIVEDTKTVANLDPVQLHGAQGKTYALMLKLIYDIDVDLFRTNQLRKVKRTARAKPPFYGRSEMFVNKEALRHQWSQINGQLSTMVELMQYHEAEGTSDRAEYDELFYPSPMATCSWDCDFLAVCKAMDDGSNFEYIIRNSYRHKPLTPAAEGETIRVEAPAKDPRD